MTRSLSWRTRDEPTLYHGGDLAAARRLFPGAPEPWIDLSTGIHPEPYPIPALPLEIFTRLPAAERLEELEASAARRYGAPPGAKIVAAPGTQALIQLLPQLHKAKSVGIRSVGILGFTYGEYERVWRAAGLAARVVEDLDGLSACDLAIIANPNNPDGRLVPAEDLAALAHHFACKGGLLVIDEAFMDLLPLSQSLVPVLPERGALVLRSFGKTYGLPGVRLGFAVTGATLAERLRLSLGPWAVSGPAIEIGRAALADDAWFNSIAQRLPRRGAIIEKALRQCGAEVVGSTPLFRLFAHAEAERLFAAFGREGVLLRRFPARPNWLRAGLVADVFEERFKAIAAMLAVPFPALRGEVG